MIKVLEDMNNIGMDKLGKVVEVYYTFHSGGILVKKEVVIGVLDGFSKSVPHNKNFTEYKFFFKIPEQNFKINLPIVRENTLHEEDADFYDDSSDGFDDVHSLNMRVL